MAGNGGKLPLGLTTENHLCAEPDQHYTFAGSKKLEESMMGRWTFPMAAGIAIAACGPECSAQSLISKKYVLDRGRSDDAFRAIASAVHTPFDVEWPDLRRRLYKSSLPTDGFRITSVAGQITISDDTPRPIIHVLSGGQAMKWKINDGQIIDVSAKTIGESVFMTYRSRL
jgi:hypothetical protein